MKLNLLAAFAGGVLLAAAAFYVASRPGEPRARANETNDTVVPPAVPAPAPEAAPAAEPVAAPAPPAVPSAPKRKPARVRTAKRFDPRPLTVAAAPAPSPVNLAALAPELPAEVAAPDLVAVGSTLDLAPLEPRVVTIPEKTTIAIRLGERLASDRSVVGDAFFGTLDAPLVVDGWVIAERGARVLGRVTDVEAAGRVQGVATLTLELSTLIATDGQRIPLRTARFIHQGDTSKKGDAVKVGIGAAIGAAAGGKGAAIGAAAGGAAGAGAVALTRGKAAVLETETRISFQLEQPVTVTER